MDITDIVNLTSRAWSLNILTLMQDGVPGRQAALLRASGASRTAFVQSLDHLINLGLLERNPGHGHPLRLEFRLTEKGRLLAGPAKRASLAAPDHAVLRRAWAVPILAVSQKPKFFGQIKSDLGAITDRALSQTLKDLQAQNWMTRQVNSDLHPPRAVYQAANAGALIGQAFLPSA